jgi:hypothetical protein
MANVKHHGTLRQEFKKPAPIADTSNRLSGGVYDDDASGWVLCSSCPVGKLRQNSKKV